MQTVVAIRNILFGFELHWSIPRRPTASVWLTLANHAAYPNAIIRTW